VQKIGTGCTHACSIHEQKGVFYFQLRKSPAPADPPRDGSEEAQNAYGSERCNLKQQKTQTTQVNF
jgi:hypothetical protein